MKKRIFAVECSNCKNLNTVICDDCSVNNGEEVNELNIKDINSIKNNDWC